MAALDRSKALEREKKGLEEKVLSMQAEHDRVRKEFESKVDPLPCIEILKS